MPKEATLNLTNKIPQQPQLFLSCSVYYVDSYNHQFLTIFQNFFFLFLVCNIIKISPEMNIKSRSIIIFWCRIYYGCDDMICIMIVTGTL